MGEFKLGGAPWIRSHLREDERPRCPFCGSRALVLSDGDVRDDDLRIELYCDNSDCNVREMTILAMRIAEPNQRADVRALQEIDTQGDPDGMSTADTTSRVERDQRTLERRRNDARFTLDVH